MTQDPQLLYIVFILPALFALTLIIEGIHNIFRVSQVRLPELFRKESGWLNLSLGIFLLLIGLIAYIIISTKIK